ncbi:hypothetical protein [Tessaracoccus sp. MC1756]|uniref:hypothetical protein n=1 Tax=Tessaracoccus sp. MC1756 TaxID=2760311 RepID=UPI0016035D60|nr:hypothetical protein [Tessaracoccus sp. MC1756]MBB1508993.1 hypothetical protein [Tessaracoccus sp. MC1756]
MMEMNEPPATGLSRARAALLAAAAGYAVLVVYQAYTLPDRVPGQIGPGGEVARWSDRPTHVLMACLAGLGLFLAMWFAPRLIGRLPVEAVNLPHRDYWLRPENLPRTRGMIADDMGWFGAATIAFVGFALDQVGRVAAGQPGFSGAFWAVLVTYLVGALGWALWSTVGGRWKPPPHPFG